MKEFLTINGRFPRSVYWAGFGGIFGLLGLFGAVWGGAGLFQNPGR
jgi:hypothetical protein